MYKYILVGWKDGEVNINKVIKPLLALIYFPFLYNKQPGVLSNGQIKCNVTKLKGI